jgi:hypothetical protein
MEKYRSHMSVYYAIACICGTGVRDKANTMGFISYFSVKRLYSRKYLLSYKVEV